MNRMLTLLMLCFASATVQADAIDRGEYLTTILGCGGCHTDGALIGQPEPAEYWLAGSRIGVAWTDFNPNVPPAIVFPSNLTSDDETGLGRWSEEDIARAIRMGSDHQGGRLIGVMPWMNYALLSDQDTADIAAYLKALPPVRRAVPDNVEEGEPSPNPYVRIGVFIYESSLQLPAEFGEVLPDCVVDDC